MSELATVEHGSALALSATQSAWSDQQLVSLRHLLGDSARNVTKADLDVFHHVCQRTGLDPFGRQIHMVERQGKWTIQTGIDGLRLVARRAVDASGESMSISGGEWCGQDGVWRDVWLASEPPAAARVVVRRGSGEFVGVVTFAGYCQRKRDGSPMFRWATDPAGQLAKCAEAKALRMGFPQDLAGVYSDDEMGQADNPEPTRQSGLASALSRTHEPLLLDTGSNLAKAMFAAINGLGIADDERIQFVSAAIGRTIESTKEMTEDEARQVLAHIDEINAVETVEAEIVADPVTGEIAP